MKKRKGRLNSLGYLLILAGFWILGCAFLLFTNGDLVLYNEDGEPFSSLLYLGGYLLIILVSLLVALIPGYFLFLFAWSLLCLAINILLINKFGVGLWVIVVFVVSTLSSVTFNSYGYGSVRLFDKIKYIPSGYKELHTTARFEWVDLFDGHLDDKEKAKRL